MLVFSYFLLIFFLFYCFSIQTKDVFEKWLERCAKPFEERRNWVSLISLHTYEDEIHSFIHADFIKFVH